MTRQRLWATSIIREIQSLPNTRRPSIFVKHGSVQGRAAHCHLRELAIRSDYTSTYIRIEERMKQVRDEFHENSSHQCRVCTHASNRVIYVHEDWFSLGVCPCTCNPRLRVGAHARNPIHVTPNSRLKYCSSLRGRCTMRYCWKHRSENFSVWIYPPFSARFAPI